MHHMREREGVGQRQGNGPQVAQQTSLGTAAPQDATHGIHGERASA